MGHKKIVLQHLNEVIFEMKTESPKAWEETKILNASYLLGKYNALLDLLVEIDAKTASKIKKENENCEIKLTKTTDEIYNKRRLAK